MGRSRLTSWIVFAGVLLLVAGSGLSESLLSQWSRLSGPQSLDKLSVNVDLSADPTGAAGLTLEEADKLADKWGRPAAYSARTLSAVSAEERTASADVIGVGGRYDSFASFPLHSGSVIAAQSIERRSRVAAISAELADRLFQTRDVVGMTVRLIGATFKIVGVYEPSASLLGWMTDNDKPDMLVPITTLIELNPSVKISTVELEAGPSASVTGEADVRSALTAIGKPPSRYRIVNYVTERSWVAQKPKLLLAAAGATALLLCVRLGVRRLKRSISLVRQGLEADDWTDAVRRRRLELAADAAAVVGLAACAVLIWMAIRLRIYVPVDYVPDELIDGAFYRDKWLEWWRSQVGAMGYVSAPAELLANRVNLLVTRLTAAGALIGLPLLWVGVREWGMMRLATDARIVRLIAYTGTAVLLAAAVSRWAGTGYTVKLQEMFVLGALFALAAMSAAPVSNQSNEGMSNDVEKSV